MSVIEEDNPEKLNPDAGVLGFPSNPARIQLMTLWTRALPHQSVSSFLGTRLEGAMWKLKSFSWHGPVKSIAQPSLSRAQITMGEHSAPNHAWTFPVGASRLGIWEAAICWSAHMKNNQVRTDLCRAVVRSEIQKVPSKTKHDFCSRDLRKLMHY